MIYVGMFVLGSILGYFYNFIGHKFPKKETNKTFDNYYSKIKNNIVPASLTGILFVLASLSFGFTLELIIALTFISLLIIVVVSDYHYMIISDTILIIFSIILVIEILFISDTDILIKSLIDGIFAFGLMYGLKLLGDFIFKKESMGGGDIKLMFIIGLILSFPMAMTTVFFASIIGLPISLLLMKKNTEHIIPFGPFLAIAAIIILLLQIDLDFILNIYN